MVDSAVDGAQPAVLVQPQGLPPWSTRALHVTHIQSDLFVEHPSVTSELRDTRPFRVPLSPGASDALDRRHEAMADKVQTVSRERLGQVRGLADEDMLAISRVLAVFLGVV